VINNVEMSALVMIMKLLDDQLRRQGRRTAERVVYHHDVFDIEYIIHGRDDSRATASSTRAV
jgi:hypothetical protein